MQYQINYYSALKALVLPLDITFLLLFIGVPVVNLVAFLYSSRNKINKNYRIKAIFVSAALCAFVTLILTLQFVGSGWVLKGNSLMIKSPPVESTIDLATATISLEDSSGSWQPVYRTNGSAISGISTGWYRLRNGENAVVFRYMGSSKMVVVRSMDRTYILESPGVEDLYYQLSTRMKENNRD